MHWASPMSPTQHHTLTPSTFFRCIFCLSLLLELAGQANCHPTFFPRVSNRLVRPQNQVGSSRRETVQTENKINVLGVAVVERCKLSFTPVSMLNAPAVQVVKSCTFEPVGGTSGDSTGQCGPTPPTVTITSMSTGVLPASTAATSSNTTIVSTMVNMSSSTLSDTFTSIVSGSTSSIAIVSQSTFSPVTNATTTAPSASRTVTLSFTSLPGASNTGSSQTPALSSAPSTTSSTISPSTASASSPLSYNPSSSLSLDSTPAPAQTPESNISSTITSTTTLSGVTSPANNVASTPPQQSSALPKVIGAFAGVAVLLLIIGGTIGYLKMKKLNKKEEPISWPIT